MGSRVTLLITVPCRLVGGVGALRVLRMGERRAGQDGNVQKKRYDQPERRISPQAAENGEKTSRTRHQGTAPSVRIVAKRKRKSNI